MMPNCPLTGSTYLCHQVDAQTPDAQMPVVLYLSPATKSDDGRHLPAIHFGISRTPPSAANITTAAATTTTTTGSGGSNGGSNAEIFRHFILTVKNLTVNIEEELVYKVERFARHAVAHANEVEEEEETEVGSLLELQLARMASASQLTRYYVGTLRLTLSQVRLSVQRTPKLRPDLVEVKRRLGLSLIAFEDATIDLGEWVKNGSREVREKKFAKHLESCLHSAHNFFLKLT